jgi:HlyD family secretion protein
MVCENCPAAFYLGEQAEAFVTVAVLPRALMVPEAAVAQFDGKRGKVWTVEQGRLQRRQVALGKRSLDGRIQIRADLPEGALVAARPGANWREGRSVTVMQDTAP